MKGVKKPEEPTTEEKVVICISVVVVAVLVTIAIIYAFSHATPVKEDVVAEWGPAPCGQDWRYNCTKTMTEAPVEDQLSRAQTKIDQLQHDVTILLSLPTAQKERYEKEKKEFLGGGIWSTTPYVVTDDGKANIFSWPGTAYPTTPQEGKREEKED